MSTSIYQTDVWYCQHRHETKKKKKESAKGKNREKLPPEQIMRINQIVTFLSLPNLLFLIILSHQWESVCVVHSIPHLLLIARNTGRVECKDKESEVAERREKKGKKYDESVRMALAYHITHWKHTFLPLFFDHKNLTAHFIATRPMPNCNWICNK